MFKDDVCRGDEQSPADGQSPPQNAALNGRIQLLDALRGLSILLMVAYHCGYNLVVLGYMPPGVLYNPLLSVLQSVFAGLFIVLAGISSRFSKNNLKRGLWVLGAAALVTLASLIAQPEGPIWFGILHFMAACILLYALLDRLRITVPFVLLAAFLTLYFKITRFPDIWSADYFPLVPWAFLFFFGVWLGGPIRAGRFPRRFYTLRIPFLPKAGRHTLLIYLLHQPVLYGVLWLVGRIGGNG